MESVNVRWKSIDNSVDYLEYAKLMSESFGEEPPASSLAEEVTRELCDDHPLKSRVFEPLFYRVDEPNEFIFSCGSKEYPHVLIHLTWSKEQDVAFPHIKKVDIDRLNVQDTI